MHKPYLEAALHLRCHSRTPRRPSPPKREVLVFLKLFGCLLHRCFSVAPRHAIAHPRSIHQADASKANCQEVSPKEMKRFALEAVPSGGSPVTPMRDASIAQLNPATTTPAVRNSKTPRNNPADITEQPNINLDAWENICKVPFYPPQQKLEDFNFGFVRGFDIKTMRAFYELSDKPRPLDRQCQNQHQDKVK